MSTNKIKSVAESIEKILKESKRPIPVGTLADTIREVIIPDPEGEWDEDVVEVSSSDIIDSVKANDKFLKFYGDSVGLKESERDFWYYEIIEILENENKSITMKEIISKLSQKYRIKFGLDINDQGVKNDVYKIVEETIRAFDNEFDIKYEKEKHRTKKASFGQKDKSILVLHSVGLKKWLPPVTLLDEIMAILTIYNSKLDINRLCYKINDRKKYFNEDFLDISDDEVREIISKHPDKLKLCDNDKSVELIKS